MTAAASSRPGDADRDWRATSSSARRRSRALLGRVRRIAVLGIKTAESGSPPTTSREYAQQAGYEVVPVPVYYPEVTEILGEPVYRTPRRRARRRSTW